MSLLDINKLKLKPPVKETFMGQDVYILPALNASQMLARYRELSAIEQGAEDYSLQVAAVYVRFHIVDDKNQPLFSQSIEEIMQGFDARAIDRLYGLVDENLLLLEADEAEKNS